ncbi:MAG: hypothetical protein H6712_17505 [Myxococcales bacterium]|nr:hypothetical protein [Myxococcales bacterium]MCB9715670.1 hypothetical protein [Myxococcales bacterium]
MQHRSPLVARGLLAAGLGLAACTGSAGADDGATTAGDASSTADPQATADDTAGSSSGRVLMVVAYNDTWWPEYKVMLEGLEAAGYEVEVRSSTDGAVAHVYGDRVDEVTPGLVGVDPVPYEDFRARFAASFGAPWDPAWNEPAAIPLDGRVQDAVMGDYVALVIPGGSGSQHFRYDGDYEDLPSPIDPAHVSPAADMESAAAAIQQLVIDALIQGSPVLAVCHAGPTPGFARVPGTQGQGPDGLGLSLLAGRRATGFPLDIEVFGARGDVAEQYAALGIEFLPQQVVVVDGPELDLDGDGTLDGAGLVVTARSWYPEEVVQGLRTMLDRLE